MRGNTVARSYAEALFELGQRTGKHTDFASSLQALAAVLVSDRSIRDFLNTPRLEAETKKNALRDALGGRVPPLFLNFILVVFDKRRQRLLPEIANEYNRLLDEQLGLLNVQVTLAHEPDERAEREITADLSRILGRKVIPHVQVDRAILGGIIVRWGDHLMDGSLRRRLVRLRESMLQATVTA